MFSRGLGIAAAPAPQKRHRLEDDVALTGVPRFTQLEADLAVCGPRQAAAGEWWAKSISEKSLEFLTSGGFD